MIVSKFKLIFYLFVVYRNKFYDTVFYPISHKPFEWVIYLQLVEQLICSVIFLFLGIKHDLKDRIREF